jgi:site-specific DNA-methyltransferase (adenine-specific)
MELQTVTIESLTLDPNNARKHSKRNLDSIAASLVKFGQRKPLVVHRGVVLAGNGTLEAARSIGWKDIEVTYVPDDWDADTAKAYALADNRSSELAEWDDKILSTQLLDLDEMGWNIEALGFEPLPLRDLDEDEDDIPEPPVEPVSKLGQIYQLGRHRLMCGDSTDFASVERLMDGTKINMLFTDPPYGVDYEGVNNDFLKGEKFREFLTKAFKNAFQIMEEGSNAYVWHADIHAYECIGAFRDAGFTQARPSIIQWVKDSLVLSQGDYHSRNEPCLYGWKAGKERVRVSDRTQDTIWEFPKPKKADGHPTMKPIALCERAINNSSRKNDAIFDPFAGSGSTLIACQQTERICYAIELDPIYIDLVIQRWENLTGLKAELIP